MINLLFSIWLAALYTSASQVNPYIANHIAEDEYLGRITEIEASLDLYRLQRDPVEILSCKR